MKTWRHEGTVSGSRIRGMGSSTQPVTPAVAVSATEVDRSDVEQLDVEAAAGDGRAASSRSTSHEVQNLEHCAPQLKSLVDSATTQVVVTGSRIRRNAPTKGSWTSWSLWARCGFRSRLSIRRRSTPLETPGSSWPLLPRKPITPPFGILVAKVDRALPMPATVVSIPCRR
jgi:hypothetical protein